MTELITKQIESKIEKSKPYLKYIVGAAAIFAVWFSYNESQKNRPDNQITELNSPEVTNEQSQKCVNSWEMSGINHDNGDWVGGGIPEIKNGSDRNAREVFNDWLGSIDNDPELLVYFLTTINSPSVNADKKIDRTNLVDDAGCASETATLELENAKQRIELATITFEDAPNDGQNSHIENDVVVKNSTTIIDGDRKAIKIAFEDGYNVWVLGVCGNLVTKEIPKESKDVEIHKRTTTKHKTIVIENKKVTDNKEPTIKKSNDKSDYKKPGDDTKKDTGSNNKKAENISSPAESKPPKVEANNDKPASQTDTKAPESSPSKPASDKQNEGGSNNGSITD
jgi:hypothetical protein